MEQSPVLFGRKSDSNTIDIEALTNHAYQQIGQARMKATDGKMRVPNMADTEMFSFLIASFNNLISA